MCSDVIAAYDLTVTMDHAQFMLRGSEVGYDPEDDLALLDEALTGPGIAARDDRVLVVSPHQNNYEMRIRVEVWRREPPDDLPDWEEAFEAGIRVDRDGELRYDSPMQAGAGCLVPEGRYRVRVTGRGFVSRGWPGSTRPGDRWRVQLWPADGVVGVRRLLRWTEPGEDAGS